MEFKDRESLINFEREREKYFYNWHSICNRKHLLKFYIYSFLETFHPKYRAIKELYEGYNGGWYKNKNGIILTKHLSLIDTNNLREGDYCCELGFDYDENNVQSIYIYHKNILMKI